MRGGVTIQTGARLHFGLLAHRPRVGRHFGGVGLMISSPGVKLTATRYSRDQVFGPAFLHSRVETLMSRYRQHVTTENQPPPCRIEIHEFIPAHQGLGSGTQLALAVGKAMALLSSEEDLSAAQLAQRVGRGVRSALGLHGFESGGFLVDGGKTNPEELGTLVARVEVPSEWRIVLISPDTEAGLFGTDEQTAFHDLPGMSEELTSRLCRLIVMELLPALVERDFTAFSDAVFGYGQQVGAYFEPIQGGRFASAAMAELASELRKRDIPGVGQSSWGPTVFVLQESQTAAEQLVRGLQTEERWSRCQFHIAAPLNHGAEVFWV